MVGGRRVRLTLSAILLVAILLPTVGTRQPASAASAAGDVTRLLNATAQGDVESGLATVLVNSGFAMTNSGRVIAGAQPDAAVGEVPDWLLTEMATTFAAGKSVSIADLAHGLDAHLRANGGTAVDARSLAAALGAWVSSTGLSGAERYAADALEELGRHTVPSYDLAAGTAVAARLPYWSLLLVGAYAGVVPTSPAPAALAPIQAVLADDPVPTTGCGALALGLKIGMAVAGPIQSAKGWLSGLLKGAAAAGESAAEAAGQAGEAAASTAASVVTYISQLAVYMTQRHYWTIDVQQAPNPAVKQLPGREHKRFVLTVSVKSTTALPQKVTDCFKAAGLDIPDESAKPKGLEVRVDEGADFEKHLTFSPDDYRFHAYGLGNLTDDSGQAKLPIETLDDRGDPPGKGPLRDVHPHVTISAQVLAFSVWGSLNIGGDLVAAFDAAFPKDLDFAPVVQEHAPKGRTVAGSFDLNLGILDANLTISGHSCTGPGGPYTAKIHLGGGYQGGAAAAVKGLTGLQPNGQGDLDVSFTVPTTKNRDGDDIPVVGKPISLGGSFGLVFTSEDTGRILLDNEPIPDGVFGTAGDATFYTLKGASECNE